MSDYPEHDKLAAASERHAAAVEFYDYLVDGLGLTLCEWEEGLHDDRLIPARRRPAALIAGFLGIDEAKLEAEKVAMLDAIRKANA